MPATRRRRPNLENTSFRVSSVKLTVGAMLPSLNVNVAEYPDGYSIKGLYTIKNEIVNVRGRLFKGRLPVGEFQVKNPKNDLDGLVEAIINKISDMVK